MVNVSHLDRFLSGETRQLRWCFLTYTHDRMSSRGPFSLFSSHKKTAITGHVAPKIPLLNRTLSKDVKLYVITKIHHVYLNFRKVMTLCSIYAKQALGHALTCLRYTWSRQSGTDLKLYFSYVKLIFVVLITIPWQKENNLEPR